MYSLIGIGCAALAAAGAATEMDAGDIARPFVTQVGDRGYLATWDVTGPFPSQEVARLFTARVEGEPFAASIDGLRRRHRTTTVFRSTAGMLFKTKRFMATLLSADIVVPVDGTYRLTFGTDGPLRAWIDQRQVLASDRVRKALPDTELVTIALNAGRHRIHVVMKNGEKKWWRGYVRLLTHGFEPADDLRVETHHVAGDTEAMAATGTLMLERDVDFENRTVRISPELRFNGGTPFEQPSCDVSFSKIDDTTAAISARRLPLNALGSYRFDTGPIPESVTVTCGTASFTKLIGIHYPHITELAEAITRTESALFEGTFDKTTKESMLWRVDHLRRLITAGDRDYLYLTHEIRNTRRMAELLCDGEDPYLDRRNQVQRRGYRSDLDGALHPYVLYVPPAWREAGDRKFPLVVMLHGLGSAPMKAMQSVFGLPLREEETGEMRARHPEPVAPVPFFVLTPDAFGPSGYRGYGEVDVREVMADVMTRYRIHPDRVYITGASMGGIGAAAIPLRYPDTFAAAAPLCGYHSLFVYRKIRELHLKPWERFLLGFRSNSEWAANGRHLPLYVVHGLKDTPMHSRVLAREYQRRAYAVKMETPDLGHNVWDETFAKQAIFTHFAKYRRDAHPKRVTFRTARLRYRKAFWVSVDDVVDFGNWAKIDAMWQFENRIAVRTQNISAFTLTNDPVRRMRRVHEVMVDDQTVPVSSEAPSWSLVHTDAGWRLRNTDAVPHADPAPLRKRPGLAGPIDDAFYEPLLFVYSSRDPAEEALTKTLAYRMRKPKAGVSIAWPVKRDVEVTPEDLASKSIVVIGTPSGNTLMKRLAPHLPIRIDGEKIAVQDRVYSGEAPAASFIYPNPLNPNRYVLIHTGGSVEALFYTDHLPETVPDYLIYDGPRWHRKRERVLTDRPVLEAGFFDANWQPKKQVSSRAIN